MTPLTLGAPLFCPIASITHPSIIRESFQKKLSTSFIQGCTSSPHINVQ